jgi:hypothetical protein
MIWLAGIDAELLAHREERSIPTTFIQSNHHGSMTVGQAASDQRITP